MYYSEFERIKRIERLLAQLAYFSLIFDFVVAIATFMLFEGVTSSMKILILGDYLLFAEVVAASALMVLIVTLRHYQKLMLGLAIPFVEFKKLMPKRHLNASGS